MTNILTSSRLLVLSCSMTKRAGPKWMPARDRYDGPLWRTLRHVDPGEDKARVAFLSAEYGFRDAKTTIENYDARMTPEIAASMKAGGLGTRWPRPKTQRRVMPSGEHPAEHIASMTAFRRTPFVDVCLVGGALYLDVMRHFVELFREDGFVTGSAPVMEICAPIGIMRRELAVWLNDPPTPTRGEAGAGGKR
ncbi:hypothetical protein HW571_21705 [Agrobacterium genomosp. 3]|uniref:hypothetical protein n=1 Tax=Agrobacterium tomkonis TaxID=1183410 RepID=UPI001CD84D42|nr:hypothetical protein [Agrobacterium tomkonis]MCA1878719.1 hypothetical protein [Agrobacterium tumefaciens]MCA1893944.1 hypothetical protein [Agrobacterium tomkonis]